jgi:hypothetical protein
MIHDDDLSLLELLSKLSLEFIQDRISFVRQADLEEIEIDDLKTALAEILKAYGTYVKSIRQGEPVFRVMKHQPNEKLFENVSRIYPDPTFLTKLGRANRKHQPVYYFCGEPGIAFHEVKIQPGEVATLLECRPRNDESPRVVPIGIDQLLSKHGVKAGGDFPENSVRIQHLLGNNADALKKYWIIDEFLTNQFLKDVPNGQEHEYKISVAIAEFLFKFSAEAASIDGIAYPSLAGAWKHANLALVPESFHRIYQPFACARGKLARLLPELGLSFDVKEAVIAVGIDPDGTIRWPKA